MYWAINPHSETRARTFSSGRTASNTARPTFLETDVDASRAGRRQLPGEIVAAAVDAGIEAQIFHDTFVAVNSKGDALVPLMNAFELDATHSSCTALPLAK